MSRTIKAVLGFLGGVAVMALVVFLCPYLFMVLWNDMTPRFGVDIPFTWWDVVKLWVLVGGIRFLLTGNIPTTIKTKS